MKKIISVLIVAVMLLSSLMAIIPASAAKGSYSPDIPSATYLAYDKDGKTFSLSDWHNYFITTKIGDVLAAKKKNNCDNAVAYISNMQFTITSTTKYEYEVYARNNSTGRYCGVPFAISPDNKVYFAYGCFDNVSDNVSGQSYIITAHGSFDNKYPSPSDELGAEYHETLKQYTFDYTVNNGDGTTKPVTAPFAKLKFVYEGLTVKVYAEDSSGTYVQMGHDVTLATGSKLVFGIYCRDTKDGANRTGAIKAPKITGMNSEAVEIMQNAGANVVLERDTEELEALIREAKTQYVEAEYTEESWAALEEAISAAEGVLDDMEAADDEIELATTLLQEAIDGLEIAPLDTSELEALIKAAKSLESKQAEYNMVSYKMLMNKVAEGEDILALIENGDDVTQAQVVEACNNIREKMEALKDKNGDPAPFDPDLDEVGPDEPVEEPTEEPTDEPSENPGEESSNLPVEDPSEEPTEEDPTKEDPTEEDPTEEEPTEEEPTEKEPDEPNDESGKDDATASETVSDSQDNATETKNTVGVKLGTSCAAAVATTSIVVGLVASLGAALVIKKKED